MDSIVSCVVRVSDGHRFVGIGELNPICHDMADGPKLVCQLKMTVLEDPATRTWLDA